MVFLFQSNAQKMQPSQLSRAELIGKLQTGVTEAFTTQGLAPPKRYAWDLSKEIGGELLGLKITKPTYNELKIFVSSYKTDKLTNTPSEMKKFIVQGINNALKDAGLNERVDLGLISHNNKQEGVIVYTVYLPPTAIPKK